MSCSSLRLRDHQTAIKTKEQMYIVVQSMLRVSWGLQELVVGIPHMVN